jgi:hypothetical protein
MRAFPIMRQPSRFLIIPNFFKVQLTFISPSVCARQVPCRTDSLLRWNPIEKTGSPKYRWTTGFLGSVDKKDTRP